MGEVKLEDIFEILDNYDKDNITIATLGSHTSLHILQGAKEEGFRTAIVCEKGREVPYQRFDVADEYIIVDKFKDIVNEDVQQKLRDMNAIVIPHGSFVAYAGLDNVEDKFNVPMFGNRDILRWEAERDKERALLVEDNELNMEIAQFILENENMQTSCAWNGKEAVDIFARSKPGEYDLILMDIMMPVMDGLEAARQIRVMDRPDAKLIPIVAMSANAFQDVVERSKKAGMNKHISKPLTGESVIREIKSML